MKVVPVIIAGGAGKRLWPLSNENKPKQFHDLTGEGTLLYETINRLLPLSPEMLLIVTSHKYESITKKEINKFNLKGTVLSEPRPRNTAAAILYAAIYLDKAFDDSIMIILPSDHYIKDKKKFIKTLKIAINQAKAEKLVTIGIKPAFPETGYGYIKSVNSKGNVLKVDQFTEKPDINKAKLFYESDNYFWNSGIFIWKTETILNSFKKLMPDHFKAFQKLHSFYSEEIESNNPDIWKIKNKIFSSIDPISIDYGILEKEDDIIVIPGKFGWTDLGSWKSLDEILPSDKNNNRSSNKNKAIYVNSNNCSVFSEKSRVSLVGLSNIIVVESNNEILIIDKDQSQDVKLIVDKLN